LAGRWEFPGGKIEPGETPKAALARELSEELGLEARVGEALTPVVLRTARGELELLPYRIVAGGEPVAREHAELRWCTGAELAALDWAPADVPVVTELLRLSPHLRGAGDSATGSTP
jgi:8-oxo-dGTP diphosphatase